MIEIASVVSAVYTFAKRVREQCKLASENDRNCAQLLAALDCLCRLLEQLAAVKRPTTSSLSEAIQVKEYGHQYIPCRCSGIAS